MKRNKPLLIFGCLLFIASAAVFLYPYFHGALLEHEQSSSIQSFYQLTSEKKNDPGAPTDATMEDLSEDPAYLPYPLLREACLAYNTELYDTKQNTLTSPTALENAGFDLTGYDLESNVFAVLKIESLNIEMPVYLGANAENLAAGAAVLGQTSLPIGGNNSNCVIAGHRGWKGADYFKHLPEIEIGGAVQIKNLWETLDYTVTTCKLILSSDFSEITIHEGEDRLTLFTCEYGAEGVKYRYLVICERTDG